MLNAKITLQLVICILFMSLVMLWLFCSTKWSPRVLYLENAFESVYTWTWSTRHTYLGCDDSFFFCFGNVFAYFDRLPNTPISPDP